MRKKNIIIIAFMALVLGLLSVYLVHNSRTGTIRKELADFSIRDTASITKIFMSDMNNNNVKLVRQNQNEWYLNDAYPVRNENINIFFKTLLWIEVREPVPYHHMDEVLARMAAIATKVEVYQTLPRINLFNRIKLWPREKLSKTFYVGDATSDQMGTYMLMENAAKPFVTYMPGFRGFLSTRFSALEKDWRDPGIFRYRLNEIKSVKLEFIEFTEHSFKLENNGDRTFNLYNVAGDMEKVAAFDTLKVLTYMSSFENVSFEALINHLSKKDSILDSQPLHVITVELFSGEKNSIKTYKKWAVEGEEDTEGNPVIYDRDRLYALINDGKDFVLIQYYVFDRVLKPLYYFYPNSQIGRDF